MPARIGPTLNATYQRFAGLLAIGYAQTDAYRECFKTKGRSDDAVKSAAHKAANHPSVKSYAQSIVDQLQLSAIDTANKAVIELIQDIKTCRELGKWNAVSQFTRMRLQIHGLLKENITLTAEQSLTDEQLVERLAGKDSDKAAMLKALLAPTAGFKRA